LKSQGLPTTDNELSNGCRISRILDIHSPSAADDYDRGCKEQRSTIIWSRGFLATSEHYPEWIGTTKTI